MIVINNHEWVTLDQDMFVYINNTEKKIMYVYAGDRLIYPSDVDISDLRKWHKSFAVTVSYANRTNDFTYTYTVPEYEKFYISFNVKRNTNYVFKAHINAGNYTEHNAGRSHTYMAVLIDPPGDEEYIENLPTIARTQFYANTDSTYEVQFNSGNRDVVYLVFELTPVTNNETVRFIISDITCRRNRSTT